MRGKCASLGWDSFLFQPWENHFELIAPVRPPAVKTSPEWPTICCKFVSFGVKKKSMMPFAAEGENHASDLKEVFWRWLKSFCGNLCSTLNVKYLFIIKCNYFINKNTQKFYFLGTINQPLDLLPKYTSCTKPSCKWLSNYQKLIWRVQLYMQIKLCCQLMYILLNYKYWKCNTMQIRMKTKFQENQISQNMT